MDDIKLIKEAIRHINEVLKSDCNEACKRDHINLRRWLNELLEWRERICKNCKWFEKNYCTHMKNTRMNEDTMIMVNENFGCNRFERR